MIEYIQNLFTNVFGDNVILATILISTIPIIEICGAIPFAVNPKLWANPLTPWQSLGWGLLGSSIITFLIAVLFIPIIKLLKRIKFIDRIACAIENAIKGKASQIEGAEEKCPRFSKGYWRKILAIFIFVAIPFPLSGAWSGTCVAIFIGLDYISTCVTVILGNITAGLILTLSLEFYPPLETYMLYIFLAFISIVIVYKIIEFCVKKCKKSENK